MNAQRPNDDWLVRTILLSAATVTACALWWAGGPLTHEQVVYGGFWAVFVVLYVWALYKAVRFLWEAITK